MTMLWWLPAATAELARLGYFAQEIPNLAACARGWLDTPDVQVQCLPQSSGVYAVDKLDSGTLDVSFVGSTPFALAVSRGVAIQAILVQAQAATGEGLVTRFGSVQSLAGSTIGVPLLSTSHYQLLDFLQVAQSLDVVVRGMSPRQIIAAWDAREIDVRPPE